MEITSLKQLKKYAYESSFEAFENTRDKEIEYNKLRTKNYLPARDPLWIINSSESYGYSLQKSIILATCYCHSLGKDAKGIRYKYAKKLAFKQIQLAVKDIIRKYDTIYEIKEMNSNRASFTVADAIPVKLLQNHGFFNNSKSAK